MTRARATIYARRNKSRLYARLSFSSSFFYILHTYIYIYIQTALQQIHSRASTRVYQHMIASLSLCLSITQGFLESLDKPSLKMYNQRCVYIYIHNFPNTHRERSSSVYYNCILFTDARQQCAHQLLRLCVYVCIVYIIRYYCILETYIYPDIDQQCRAKCNDQSRALAG